MPQYIISLDDEGNAWVEATETSDGSFLFTLDEQGNLYFERIEEDENV